MPRYHYKRYLNRAFWNSFVAVLSAFILVLIIVFGWQEIKSAMNRMVAGGGEMEKKELDRLELLESLKGNDDTSEAEKVQLLDELYSDEEVSNEEKIQLLESL